MDTNEKQQVADNFTKRFNELLNERKTDENIKTDKEIAEKIGIQHQSLINYQSGRVPEPWILLKIANYFNVSIEYLLGKTKTRNYLNYDLEKTYGFDELVIKNLKENVNKSDKQLIIAINSLLGDDCLEFIKLYADYISFPSKENKYLDEFSKIQNKKELTEKYYKKYDEDNYIYLYRICKKLEELSRKIKNSEDVAKIFMENDMLEELRNYQGD